MGDTRTEKDFLGEMDVPAGAYYGIQTLRAAENFPISGLGTLPVFTRACAMIKKAAAEVNKELDALDPKIADAIIEAADEVAMLCRCTRKVLSCIKTEEDLNRYGDLYHDLATWEHHLDILVNSDNQDKLELFRSGLYG